MLVRCPRKRNHGPAGVMWSVVHFPLTLTRMGKSWKSFPSQGVKGERRCIRSEEGEIWTVRFERSAGGETKPSSAVWYCEGRSTDGGGLKRKGPFGVCMTSVAGLNESVPANVEVRTVSGEARKILVAGLLSRRPVKLRLYEVMIELSVPWKVVSFDGSSMQAVIGAYLWHILSFPRSAAWSACIRQQCCIRLLKDIKCSTSLQRGSC